MIILRQKNYSFNSNLSEIINIDNHISLKKDHLGILAKLLRKISKRIKNNQDNFVYYYILFDNKKVGCIELSKKDKKTLYGVWLTIDEKYRGNKIATKVLEYIISLAKKLKFEYFILEVPGNSPDARHIYEKLGFKEDKTRPKNHDEEYDAIWGGLTNMILKL